MSIDRTEFEALAARVVALAADHLDALPSRAIPAQRTSAQLEAALGGPIAEEGQGAAALDALTEVIAGSRAQNGRFAGYVLGSGEPVAALADLLASVLNQNVTAYRSAPSAVVIERAVVRTLADALGCRGYEGSLMGGGSSANLAGLAMARTAAGIDGASPRRGVVYASDEVHMSIPKAVTLLGLGRGSLRRIPTDETQRIRVDLLQQAIEADVRAGLVPVAIVGNAGTVSTGAIDPLDALADLARACGAWFHVDGAYGALAALAIPHKLSGLARADSLSLDAHKWLYQPVDCGCLLFRDPSAARAAFSQTDEYVKTTAALPLEAFAFFDESPELSRRFRALKVWLSLRYHGLGWFRRHLAADLAHAAQLAERIEHTPELELLSRGELSVVCFRARGDDAFNERLLSALNAAGRVYLSNARVRGHFALRACFTNHRTTSEDVETMVTEVVQMATELRA